MTPVPADSPQAPHLWQAADLPDSRTGWMARMWATPEQWQRIEADSARRTLFWAAAVNPRDNDDPAALTERKRGESGWYS